jgi:hypothetical protein
MLSKLVLQPNPECCGHGLQALFAHDAKGPHALVPLLCFVLDYSFPT